MHGHVNVKFWLFISFKISIDILASKALQSGISGSGKCVSDYITSLTPSTYYS